MRAWRRHRNFRLGGRWFGDTVACGGGGADYGRNDTLTGKKYAWWGSCRQPHRPHRRGARGGVLGDTLALRTQKSVADVWLGSSRQRRGNQIDKVCPESPDVATVSAADPHGEEDAVEFPEGTAIMAAMISGVSPAVLSGRRARSIWTATKRPDTMRWPNSVWITTSQDEGDLARYDISTTHGSSSPPLHESGCVADSVRER